MRIRSSADTTAGLRQPYHGGKRAPHRPATATATGAGVAITAVAVANKGGAGEIDNALPGAIATAARPALVVTAHLRRHADDTCLHTDIDTLARVVVAVVAHRRGRARHRSDPTTIGDAAVVETQLARTIAVAGVATGIATSRAALPAAATDRSGGSGRGVSLLPQRSVNNSSDTQPTR